MSHQLVWLQMADDMWFSSKKIEAPGGIIEVRHATSVFHNKQFDFVYHFVYQIYPKPKPLKDFDRTQIQERGTCLDFAIVALRSRGKNRSMSTINNGL